MAAPTPDALAVRAYLGERIPDGGTATDTLFSDAEIAELLDEQGSVAAAVADGWVRKAATYANLTNVSDRGRSMTLGQLRDNAQRQAEWWQRQADAGAAGTGTGSVYRYQATRGYATNGSG